MQKLLTSGHLLTVYDLTLSVLLSNFLQGQTDTQLLKREFGILVFTLGKANHILTLKIY